MMLGFGLDEPKPKFPICTVIRHVDEKMESAMEATVYLNLKVGKIIALNP